MSTGNIDVKITGKVSGKVKWFNNAKGYGFIVEDGGEIDMFAHYSAITMEGYKTLKAGQGVYFDTKEVDNGIHAINISAIDQTSTIEEPAELEEPAEAQKGLTKFWRIQLNNKHKKGELSARLFCYYLSIKQHQ